LPKTLSLPQLYFYLTFKPETLRGLNSSLAQLPGKLWSWKVSWK